MRENHPSWRRALSLKSYRETVDELGKTVSARRSETVVL